MTKSNNIVKLLGENTTIASIVAKTRSELSKSTREVNKRELPPSEIVSDYVANEDIVTETNVPMIDIPLADKEDTEANPEEIGWKYMDDSKVWGSLILDNKGVPTDFGITRLIMIKTHINYRKGGKLTRLFTMTALQYHTNIIPTIVITKPNNWSRSIDAARSLKGRVVTRRRC